MKILICEDDFISQTILIKILEHLGDCDVASDGNEAIEHVREAFVTKKRYDLICCDIMMPGKDGFDVVTTIREIESLCGISPQNEVPIIMITALGHPKNIFAALNRCGATEYIVKPITKKMVLDVVNRVLFKKTNLARLI